MFPSHYEFFDSIMLLKCPNNFEVVSNLCISKYAFEIRYSFVGILRRLK